MKQKIVTFSYNSFYEMGKLIQNFIDDGWEVIHVAGNQEGFVFILSHY